MHSSMFKLPMLPDTSTSVNIVLVLVLFAFCSGTLFHLSLLKVKLYVSGDQTFLSRDHFLSQNAGWDLPLRFSFKFDFKNKTLFNVNLLKTVQGMPWRSTSPGANWPSDNSGKCRMGWTSFWSKWTHIINNKNRKSDMAIGPWACLKIFVQFLFLYSGPFTKMGQPGFLIGCATVTKTHIQSQTRHQQRDLLLPRWTFRCLS
jgi:hypothetical protein